MSTTPAAAPQSGNAPSGPPSVTPSGQAAEQAAFFARRTAAGIPRDAPTVGLALSGGGIRSATFCYGLLRGLAGRGLLGRVDYLSTVSGGGYIGAALGRAFDAKARAGAAATPATAHEVQRDWADPDTLAAWWLRRNGRYLTPTGVGDFGFAVATYFRSWVAVHIETGMVALGLALAIVLPHLFHFGAKLPPLELFGWIRSVWWAFALVFALATVPGLLWGYWIARDPPVKAPTPGDSIALAALVVVLVVMAARLASGHAGRSPWLGASALAVASLVAGALFSIYTSFSARAVRHGGVRWSRNLLTRGLRGALRAIGIMALAGLVDWAGWSLLLVLRQPSTSGSALVGWGTAALLVLRALLEPVQQQPRSRDGSRLKRFWARALDALGIAATLLLLLLWTTVAQMLVFLPLRSPAWFAWPEALRWVLLLLGVLGWALLTGRNVSTANATSLHSFYRARLSRAYLGIGNPERFDGPSDRPASADSIAQVRSVTAVIGGDDTDLCAYAPDRAGGPIHLINVCINQTIDDKSGLYNVDRKGIALCASRFGLQVGENEAFEAGVAGAKLGTLGQWTAISGAAASSGAGAHTSRGFSALMFFFGARLGYWWTSGRPASGPARLLAKFMLLRDEATARFAGVRSAYWYLSDGGHFENTAAYALIKRKLDFVIVADCGADPAYTCADLENLVRKARIDFGAEIEFYEADDARRFCSQAGDSLAVLSPYELVDSTSRRGVMLARILYADGTQGTLLVIKPNLHAQLDFDVLRYAQDHPLFPQEPTSDQFFDEAQWESYQRLGFDFGHALTDAWLTRLPGWAVRRQHAPIQPATLRSPGHDDAQALATASTAAAARRRPWIRAVGAAAVGTTIGLGAIGTGLVAAWQAIDQLKQSRRTDADSYEKLFRNVVERLGPDGVPDASLPLQLDLERLRDLAGQASPSVARAFMDLQAEIDASCRTRLRDDAEDPGCLWWQTRLRRDSEQLRRAELGPLDYWRRDGALAAGLAAAGAQVMAWAQRLVGLRPSTVATGPTSVPLPPAEQNSSTAEPCPGAADADLSACESPDGTPIVLYTQIYDERTRAQAQSLVQAIRAQQVPGFTAGAIEDVVETARRRSRPEPVPWRRPTLLVHASTGERAAAGPDATAACASALARVVQTCYPAGEPVAVRPLPAGLKPTPGVIELWLPPADSGTTAGG